MSTASPETVAIVAGAGRGIGRAAAIALARDGVRVVLVARTESELAEAVAACEQAGGEARAVTADVAQWEQVRVLVEGTLSIEGRVDILVNSAGSYGPIGPAAEVDAAAWAQAFEVNLFAALYLCRAVLPSMVERGSGKIVLLAGGGATSPLPRFSSYGAAKAGVVRLAETIAEEVREHNIQVNAVAPGLVDTRLQDSVLAAGEQAGELLQRVRDGRETGAGTVPPELAAELIAFLASEASGALTGKLISAPHDPWREWAGRAAEINATPMYTLRRLDPFTIEPLIDELG